MSSTGPEPSKVAWWIIGGAAAAALLLVLPNQAVVTKYINDILIFLDGAYRVGLGQVPNRDFHTALGPLVFVVPALGARITGALGTAMPAAMAIFLIVLAPALAHIASSRLRPAMGLPVAAFLILILATPINLGEGIFDLSFGMFYNRVGWAALAALLLMYLEPGAPRPYQVALDAASAALLTLVLVYTKATYGLVALAFLGGMLCFDPRQRRWAAWSLVVVAVNALVVELLWGGTEAYIRDLIAASEVSGERSIRDVIDLALRNLADFVLFALMTGLSLRRTRSLRDGIFFLFCAAAGLVLISQNFQTWGMVTLHAGSAVAAEKLLRSSDLAGAEPSVATLGAPLLLLALVLPTIVHNGAALTIYAGLSAARAGEAFNLPNYEGLRLASVWEEGDYERNGRYLATLREGKTILQSLTPKPSGVFVLDFVSPFSSVASLPPPRGDTAWQHWDRNVNQAVFVPPEELFREVEIIMEPKKAIEGITGNNLRSIYGSYLAEHFDLRRDSPAWRIYARVDSPAFSQSTESTLSLPRPAASIDPGSSMLSGQSSALPF